MSRTVPRPESCQEGHAEGHRFRGRWFALAVDFHRVLGRGPVEGRSRQRPPNRSVTGGTQLAWRHPKGATRRRYE